MDVVRSNVFVRLCRVALGVAALAAVIGCGQAAFECQTDESCGGSDGEGWCEANGACSFPDPDCPSGRRYGRRGPDGVAGQCVPVETGTSTTTSTSTYHVHDHGHGHDHVHVHVHDHDHDHDHVGRVVASTSASTSRPRPPRPRRSSSSGGVVGDPYGMCMDDGDCGAGVCEAFEGVAADLCAAL